jgi:hypothetical protein
VELKIILLISVINELASWRFFFRTIIKKISPKLPVILGLFGGFEFYLIPLYLFPASSLTFINFSGS